MRPTLVAPSSAMHSSRPIGVSVATFCGGEMVSIDTG